MCHSKIDRTSGRDGIVAFRRRRAIADLRDRQPDGTVIRPPTPVAGVDRRFIIHDFAHTEPRRPSHRAGALDMEAVRIGGAASQWRSEPGKRRGSVAPLLRPIVRSPSGSPAEGVRWLGALGAPPEDEQALEAFSLGLRSNEALAPSSQRPTMTRSTDARSVRRIEPMPSGGLVGLGGATSTIALRQR
jgi:hypothetical protein